MPTPNLSPAQLTRLEDAIADAFNSALVALAPLAPQDVLADSDEMDARILCNTAKALLAAFSSDMLPTATGGSAKAAFKPFVALLTQSAGEDEQRVQAGDKMVMPANYFLFGKTKAFMDGLPGMLEGGLLHSMAEEARQNEDGKWWPECARRLQ